MPIKSNVVSYTTIIAFMAKSQNVDEALQLVQRMKLARCKHDIFFYNSLIHILGRMVDLRRLLVFFRRC